MFQRTQLQTPCLSFSKVAISPFIARSLPRMLQRRVIFIDKYGYFLPSLFVGCHNNGIKTIGKFCCFTEFWCSDDTDPFERIYIQWSLSKFFPAKTMGSHVTNWNKNTSVKFRTDVCSSCKLGFDIDLKSPSPDRVQVRAERRKEL